MTVKEIKACVMFQTGNDADDLGDFEPYLSRYINDGYEILCYALFKKHVAADGETKPLDGDTDTPQLPDFAHSALADYATWLVYRNGNPQKQGRGMAFYQSFEAIRLELGRQSSYQDGKPPQFSNVYP